MNNMLRHIVYILFLLLLTITAEQDYHAAEPADCHSNASCYRQQQDPCKDTVDFLFTNHFADMPQIAVVSPDNPINSKFKCLARVLTVLNEYKKQKSQTGDITGHSPYPLHSDAVDYYIYALRRIII